MLMCGGMVTDMRKLWDAETPALATTGRAIMSVPTNRSENIFFMAVSPLVNSLGGQQCGTM